MWRTATACATDRRITKTRLAAILGIAQTNVSKKVRGISGWSAEDLILTARLIEVGVEDLMPKPDGMGGWIPAPYVPAYKNDPTPVGIGSSSEPPERIELSTYSLRVNRSAD